MTFVYAISFAGLLLAGFAVLAFRYARTVCLHVLVVWVYFAALPLATAWLYTGKVNARVLIGQDLYSEAMADAFTAHAYLFALYGLGVLAAAYLFRDSRVLADVERTLAAQRFRVIWLLLFLAVLGTEVLLKLTYGILISGSGTVVKMTQLPYSVSAALSLLSTLIFGLFCYLAVLSARVRMLLIPCLTYVPYVLISDGRRAMLMTLVTLFVLREFSLGVRLSRRLVWIASGALAVFILVGPVFVQARGISHFLESRGYSPVAALLGGTYRAIDSLVTGETGFNEVATNIAERGSAGSFFLSVASRNVPLQLGELTRVSVLWAIPSIFADKPVLQAEGMIQRLAHMRVLDDANSIPLVLYVDFGGLGMLLAGAYTALLLYVLAKLLGRGGQFGIFQIAVLGTFFWVAFSIETELVGHFVSVRNLVLLAPLTFLPSLLASAARRGRLRPGQSGVPPRAVPPRHAPRLAPMVAPRRMKTEGSAF